MSKLSIIAGMPGIFCPEKIVLSEFINMNKSLQKSDSSKQSFCCENISIRNYFHSSQYELLYSRATYSFVRINWMKSCYYTKYLFFYLFRIPRLTNHYYKRFLFLCIYLHYMEIQFIILGNKLFLFFSQLSIVILR